MKSFNPKEFRMLLLYLKYALELIMIMQTLFQK